MVEIEKIASDRYRLRAHGQMMMLSAQDLCELFDWLRGGARLDLLQSEARAAMQTSTIYLANGEQASAHVNGISFENGSGSVFVQGRDIKVMPLPSPWSFAWSEVVTVKRNDGSPFEIAQDPIQVSEKTAIIDRGEETTLYFLRDPAGAWREMTEQELERERRAWEADEKDMAQIRRAWRAYRNEGLGERG